MILGGDIGGTKTHLALFNRGDGSCLRPVAENRYVSHDYPGLESVMREFLSSQALLLKGRRISAAAFGIAGPVVDEVCKASNLPWVIRAGSIQEAFGIEKVRLINDLTANGYGIAGLSPDQLLTLNEGRERPEGNGALIAAGTGLGEAFLLRDGPHFLPVASEGGHSDFAPRNALEMELLAYLLERWSHVSFERVLSGPGLFNLYCFLRDSGRGVEPSWMRERIAREDPSAVVTQAAFANECDLCVKSLDLFISIYGSEAGNLALKFMAVGGLYVGGGIAPKMIDRMKDGTFMRSFVKKGRLSSVVEQIPVQVILDPRTALYGAACCAALL
ncbi:MAG: glucokinase [Acidobacteriota bacterium]